MAELTDLSYPRLLDICDSGRDTLRSPFEIEGGRLVATNGHLLISRAIRPEDPTEAITASTFPLAPRQRCVELLAGGADLRWVSTEIATLRDFCELPPGAPPRLVSDAAIPHCGQCTAGGEHDRTVECETCRGAGDIEVDCRSPQCPGHLTDCCECEGEGRSPCPRCHTDGVERNPMARKGWLGASLVNCNILHRLLSFLPDGAVSVGLRESEVAPILLDGGSYRAMLMPLRIEGDRLTGEGAAPALFSDEAVRQKLAGGIAAG